jgi:hypothetical protein
MSPEQLRLNAEFRGILPPQGPQGRGIVSPPLTEAIHQYWRNIGSGIPMGMTQQIPGTGGVLQSDVDQAREAMGLPPRIAEGPGWSEPTPIPGVNDVLNLPHEAMAFNNIPLNMPHEAMPFYDIPPNVPHEAMSFTPGFENPTYADNVYNPAPTEGYQYPESTYFPQDYPADFGNITSPATAGGLYGGVYPWDFNVPQAGTGVSDIPAGIAQNPYQYQLPGSNPFDALGNADLWAGRFTAPQYDPATLSRLLGGSGLPPSVPEDIPTGRGVEPPVLPAQPVTDQRVDPRTQPWTQGTLPGQTLSARDIANMARQPTDWRNSPLAALGRSLGNLFSQPGYSSPDYLRSMGYQQGQGSQSLWPGGPGRFGEGIATGGESPGDYYRVASEGANVIPFTGGVGGAGGSFYGGNLAPHWGSTAIGFGGGLGGGGPVNVSALGGWARRVPWYVNMPGNWINYAGHSTDAPTGYRLTPAEHAWLAAGGVRSGRQGPGIFSRFLPSNLSPLPVGQMGPQPASNVNISRHVPARQTR